MAPHYKVTYFDIKALGEPIRFLLSYGGVEFEDVRIKREDWPTFKSNTPFGQMPLLEIDDKVLHQSTAICRYLAKQYKLAGDNDWDALEIDIAVDTINDFRQGAFAHLVMATRGESADAIAKKKEVTLTEVLPFYLPKFEEMVKKNGGFFVNGKVSLADFAWTCFSDTMADMAPEIDLYKGYPNLASVSQKVHALPAIKAWIAKRPSPAASH